VRSAPRKPTYALFTHGIGTQNAGWSKYAQRKLAAACDQRNSILYAKEVYYAPLFSMQATEFLNATKEHGSKGSMSQRLSIETLADALQWATNPQLRERICHLVDYEYLQLRAPSEVVLFAHSLGCLVMLEWLRTRQAVKNVTLVTMGFNGGIFNLGGPMQVPAQVSKPGKWLNLFDKHDALGWPAHATPGLEHVVDCEVQVGGIMGATGLAHTCYLEDSDLWSQVVPTLLGLA
jgi:serine hydrolase